MSIVAFMALAIAAGFAGFVDAIAGGGGLVQLPALLIGISSKPIPMVLGTNKIPSIFGTSVAALSYLKRVRIDVGATNATLIAAVQHLALSAKAVGGFAGVALTADSDWERIRLVLRTLVRASYGDTPP